MDTIRSLDHVELLTELLQGTRRPLAATDDKGAVVMLNHAATLGAEGEMSDAIATDAKTWPPMATVKTADGQVFHLRCPSRSLDSDNPAARGLPPRLAKVANLAIGGMSDKQIAQRLGLSFATIRTYVRQIYRRLNVHSRVGLVHASHRQ